MANFGFSVGDIVTVGTLAWNVYKACSHATSEFQEVAREVVSLHSVVKQLELETSKPDSIIQKAVASKHKELETLLKNIELVLKQLDALVAKHKSLDTNNRRKRDILRFSAEGLEDVRSKIILHTSAANLFIGTLSAASLGRIEGKLDDIVDELRNGQRTTAAIAVSDDEDDPAAVKQWRTLRKELVDEGFDKQDIEDHKAWIKAEMRKRIATREDKRAVDKPNSERTILRNEESQSQSNENSESFGEYGPMRYQQPQFTNPWVQTILRNEESQSQSNEKLESFGQYDPMRYRPPQFTNPWVPLPGLTSELTAVASASAPADLPIRTNDAYISRDDTDSYGFPPPTLRRSPSLNSISSTHSEVAEYDNYGNMTKKTTTITTTRYYYSASASDVSLNSDHDALGRMATSSLPPAPQSMMGQFSSKVSSSAQKKYKCELCDKRFTRPSSLQTHMYAHTGEKPFRCDFEGCVRAFSVVSNLRRHRKVHKLEAQRESSDADSES